ncbi:MAG: hypothetical protein K2I43_03475, partial [Alistipes sp.]|nr:hypothetical protein [Alistipes sp.]
ADMERKKPATEMVMQSAEATMYGGYTAKNASLKLYKGDDKLELDIYYDINAKYLPAGKYTIGSGSTAGMIDNSPTYTYFWHNGTKLSLTSGTVEVAIVDGLYDIVAEFPTDEGDYKLTYKGAVDGFALYYDLAATAAKRLEVNDEVPGEYYIKLNDTDWKFELALDIFADPQSTTLPEGTYTVGTGTNPGTIGPASGIDIYKPFSAHERFATGTVTVTKAGDVYTLDMNLSDESGYEMKGSFTGKIADMERASTNPGDVIVLVPDTDRTPDALGTDNNPLLKFYSGDTTLSLDIYTSGGYLTAGTYTIGAGSSAGMIDNRYTTYCYLWYNNQRYALNSGTMTVAVNGDIYDIE